MSERTKKFGAVLFIDLDKFKPLNDQHGHLAGDELLKQIANQLKTCVRVTDSITRYGGDEFVILIDNSELESWEICQHHIDKYNINPKLSLTPNILPKQA